MTSRFKAARSARGLCASCPQKRRKHSVARRHRAFSVGLIALGRRKRRDFAGACEGGSGFARIGIERQRQEFRRQPAQIDALDDLADVELAGAVEFGRGNLGVPAFSRLAAGATILLDTPLADPGRLRFGDVAFGRGTCGVKNGRSAFVFDPDFARGAA